MLMKQKVNNDVTKDSPITSIFMLMIGVIYANSVRVQLTIEISLGMIRAMH